MAYIKGHNSDINMQKMMYNYPKQDLAKMNAYIKFGENMSVSSEDIERKENFSINQGP